jgi:hypothetical protein
VRTIEIVVDPKGVTTVTTRGFTGGACREASGFIEEALGRRSAETLTPEYYHGPETRNELRQSQ